MTRAVKAARRRPPGVSRGEHAVADAGRRGLAVAARAGSRIIGGGPPSSRPLDRLGEELAVGVAAGDRRAR